LCEIFLAKIAGQLNLPDLKNDVFVVAEKKGASQRHSNYHVAWSIWQRWCHLILRTGSIYIYASVRFWI